MRKWFELASINHVHTHHATDPTTVALLCKILGGPLFSFTVHGPEEFDKPLTLGLREKVHHASFVIAISEFTRSQLYRWTRYRDWPKIHVVRVGVNPRFLNHGPTPVPSMPRLVSIGRLVEQKGHAILIQAAAGLRDRGLDFELVIVGDGPMRPEIERLIEQLGLRERVRITGCLSNQGVLDELLKARALVLPSFAEGLPTVFFEALALGRPVITTCIAAHSELIESGVNGWLVAPGAIEPLADAMASASRPVRGILRRWGEPGGRESPGSTMSWPRPRSSWRSFIGRLSSMESSEVSGSHAVRLSSSVATTVYPRAARANNSIEGEQLGTSSWGTQRDIVNCPHRVGGIGRHR